MIEKIEFFTAGCPRSQITEKNLRKALKKMGIETSQPLTLPMMVGP